MQPAMGRQAAKPLIADQPVIRWRRLPDKQLGRLAGLFDGEGCVTASLTKQNRLTIRVSISMTTVEDVRLFAEAFGGEVKRYQHGKRKPFFTWSEDNGAAVEVLEFIVNNCRLKRRAAKPALEIARDMRATPAGRAISAERKAWRLELAEQIVAAVGNRPEGFDPHGVVRYLTGRTYSGKAVVASDGSWFASMATAAKAKQVTRTAICTAVRRNKFCCDLMWAYADGGAGKPDHAAAIRAAFSAEQGLGPRVDSR
jgi:hypothetical protein